MRRWKAPIFWKTGWPPGLSPSRAALDSASGRQASFDHLLERTAAAAAGEDDVAIGWRPREHRRLVDEATVLMVAGHVERVRELPCRLLRVNELAAVWGERGGNEIPDGGAYAGPR